jgi:hypothetical protein
MDYFSIQGSGEPFSIQLTEIRPMNFDSLGSILIVQDQNNGEILKPVGDTRNRFVMQTHSSLSAESETGKR